MAKKVYTVRKYIKRSLLFLFEITTYNMLCSAIGKNKKEMSEMGSIVTPKKKIHT